MKNKKAKTAQENTKEKPSVEKNGETSENSKRGLPAGLWIKCPKCEHLLLKKEYEEHFCICAKCGYMERLSPYKRIEFIADAGTFKEFAKNISPVNFLGFPGYDEKIKSNSADALVAGEAKIEGYSVIIAAMDFSFMGGSMGSVVGEKISLAAEASLRKEIPLIIFSSSGGARMQEGIISLMQMAKTSAALAKLAYSKIGYISVLTDPTTGGVAASFAMIGDINIAEKNALVGFAGPRVIEQTIRQQLPDNFQRSEFLEKHGAVDLIAERKDLKNIIVQFLKFFHKE
jgi:acetyl-CoA carboxylase carboxyl transferase subunit beta